MICFEILYISAAQVVLEIWIKPEYIYLMIFPILCSKFIIFSILNKLTPTDKDVTLEVDSVALRKLKHGIQLSLCGSTYSVVFEWRHDIFVWASMRY